MKTLGHRLTLTHTLVALVAVLLSALIAQRLIVRSYNQLTMEQALLTRGTLRVALTAVYTRQGSWDAVVASLARRVDAFPRLTERRFLLTDEAWQIHFDSRGNLEGQPLPPRLRSLSAPIVVRGQPVGYIVVPYGDADQSDEEQGFLRSTTRIVIAGGVLASSVALVIALLVSRGLTHPLRSLTLAARRLAAGERHEPLKIPADAELSEMAQAFNHMAAELEHQEALRRQLVADIAHELRTPLSVLRLQVESLEDNIELPTAEVFASLHEEVRVLSRLVDDLRLLSVADAGQLSLACEYLDAQAVAQRAAAMAELRARKRGVALCVAPVSTHTQPNGQPVVYADPQRLTQVLGNLIDNALRYTPPGGKVTLRVRPDTSHTVFEVADTGTGIAPEDLPHIFDRFYRADRARSRETGGTGLGLAIVQRLVEAQRGAVDVASTPGKGTTFAVRLPAAAYCVEAGGYASRQQCTI